MLQGAKNNLGEPFYNLIASHIKDHSKVLDLGSGIKFYFERVLTKNKRVSVSCIDIAPLKTKPGYIHNYKRLTVEKKIYFKHKYDHVVFLELAEHIDKIDTLFSNCHNALESGGTLIFSFPNLASLYCRMELLLGFQPHTLEVSNKGLNFGTGVFGKFNTIEGDRSSLHHIRGFTFRAMRDLVIFHNFKIVKIYGYDWRFKKLFLKFPSIASVNIFVCQKI